jgi:hypothetical protein
LSLGGGHGGEGGPGEWSEWLVRVAASIVEEGDGLLGWRRLKEVAVVDDVVARGRQLVAGGAVARSKRRLRSEDRGVVV